MTADDYDIKTSIRTVVEGGCLSADEAAQAMDRIMSGEVTSAQIGALITALRMRGETVEEIAGFAAAMRSHALHVDVDPRRAYDLGGELRTLASACDACVLGFLVLFQSIHPAPPSPRLQRSEDDGELDAPDADDRQ